MKKRTLLLYSVLLVVGFPAAEMAHRTAADVLEQLGIPHQLAKDCVWWSFSGGYFSYPTRPDLKQIPRNERAAIVQQIGRFAKSYTRSEEFNTKYLEYRESLKPTPPEPPKSMAEMRETQKRDLEKNIRETEQMKRTLPANQQAPVNEAIKMLNEQLKAMDDPDNPFFSREMEEMNKQLYANEVEEYKRKLAEWDQKYPPTPRHMLEGRLREFLETSKDVDYAAPLATDDAGKKVFTNPEYERKPTNWKLCFRAGKETVEAARAFAREWLEELSKGN
jgi:hypothetical protein